MKLAEAEIIAVNIARQLQLHHPLDPRSKFYGDIEELSVVQMEWALGEYEKGNHPSFDEIVASCEGE